MIEIGFKVESSGELVAYRTDGAINNTPFTLARVSVYFLKKQSLSEAYATGWRQD